MTHILQNMSDRSYSSETASIPSRRRPPDLGSFFGLPNIRKMRRNRLGFLLDAASQHGDIVRLGFGTRNLFLLGHPDYIKHVLQDHNTNYGRQTLGYQKLQLALGKGLVTSDGEFWRRQRRTMQPAFHRERVAHFAEII